jgi:CIC family chloride channel protein
MTNSARAKVTATPLFDSILLAVFAAILGAVVAYAALAFLLLIEALTTLFFGHSDTSFYMMLAELPPWRVVLAPTVGGLLVGLFVWRWMPERKNYGPAGVMEAVQEHDGNVNLKTGLGSALVSAVSIGAGASLGRYGPAVYLGAATS